MITLELLVRDTQMLRHLLLSSWLTTGRVAASEGRHTVVKNWITTNRPVFGAYLETHIQPSNSRRISSAIPRGWIFFANWEHHRTGRIVVVRRPNVLATIYKATTQTVTCGFFMPLENISLTVTYVYGFNEVERRRSLWEELESLNYTTPVRNHPWAVSISAFRHLSSEIDVTGVEDMNLSLQEAELFEAQHKGLSFTWWNNQEAKKIDHAFINQAWSARFPEAYVEFLEPLQSDHSSCLFHVPSAQRRVPKPFKFFNHIIDHPSFEETVREAWHPEAIMGTDQFKLVRSPKILKKELRMLNKTHYSGITQRVKTQGEIVA
ncbi:unnamed protein product, partial [Brassica oleracea]